MNYKILFPSEPFNVKNFDEDYLPEKNACDILGIEYSKFDYDTFIRDGQFNSDIDFTFKGIYIYRGWMMNISQYSNLYSNITQRSKNNIILINDQYQYENCHCFHRVYDYLTNYTPRILVSQYSNGEACRMLESIDFDFIIKDYVKSIKTSNGIEKISKDISMSELQKKINHFVKERGMLFTGKIVFKKYVELKKYDNKTNEWRAFFFNGKLLSLLQNSYLNTTEAPSEDFVKNISQKISHKSNFFTIDFAFTEDNKWIVIETGDGQVSGLPEGEELGFFNKLKESLV